MWNGRVRGLTCTLIVTLLAAGSMARPSQAVEIGGRVYTGVATFNGGAATPTLAPAPELSAITDAKVMVQSQHSGGTFITYGVLGPTGACPACATNEWRATVPDDGDYVILFSAPGHGVTSREVTVDVTGGLVHPKQTAGGLIMSSDPLAVDAYLPPLPLPLANLLVFTFYDNSINGEWDDGDDAPLNGVTVRAWDDDGNLLATGVTGTQPPSSIPVPEDMGSADGSYYFTDLPPGVVKVTSDPSTCYRYDANGDLAQLPTTNPAGGVPFDFDPSTEFYLLSSEEGSRAFEVVLFPGDPGTEEQGFLAWHGFVEKLGQITAENVKERFGIRGSIIGAGKISGKLADADQSWEFEIPDPGEWEPPEALVSAQHPGVSANTVVPDGLIILHPDRETGMSRAVATAEADPVTGAFEFLNVPPGRYRMFCCDVPIDYVYVQREVYVYPGQHVIIPNPWLEPWLPGIMVPRFFARAQGFVKNNTTGEPMPGAEVHVRLKDGSVWRTEFTDATGWYNFDDLPEVEVMAYVDVELPAGYRGAIVTDTFYPDAVWLNPWCNPILPQCVDVGAPYAVTHNAMNRYVQWYTANYRADLLLDPIPSITGDVAGFVFYDNLDSGSWVGNGLYDESDDRTMHGVTVELWDATETTLIATTTTGQVDKAAVLAQGWMQPYTFPLDEWGGVFVGPLPGFYEFRDRVPGEYRLKVIPPVGFASSPIGSDMITVAVTGGARVDQDFGINTLVPLAGEIEGGVWDDVFVDPRPLSLMYLEKAGIDGAPVGVYDHLGYFLGASYQGDPMCYEGANVGPDPLTQCPADQPLGQKPETERRFAPAPLLYVGNDPTLPGYNDEYQPLMVPYTVGQGKYKFEADWSLIPVAFGQGPMQMVFPPIPPPAPPAAPSPPPPVINDVAWAGNFLITGLSFGVERGFSTVTLSGRELAVISWSDTEIRVESSTDPISGPMIVTTHGGPSNAAHIELNYTPARAIYMAERSVYVDAGNTDMEDGSQAHPWSSIREAVDNLPIATPRYVFIAAGYYNERIQIVESDIQFIGAGPLETTVDALGSMQLSVESQGFVGRGPVFFIGQGGRYGAVSNILISGLTITRGTVDDDIGCGIFGDAGNRDLDINTCIIDHNGGYYGGAIWLQKTNHDVRIWSNTISNNGCGGGYSGGISVNDEPEYGPHHGEPEHIVDDEIPGCPPGTYEIFNNHLFRNFSPDYGGAISLYEVKDHLIIAGNLIEDNHADDHGGAVFFEDSGPIELYGNIIRRNSNFDDGGAISFEDVTDHNATVRVHHNVIAMNWADDHGENRVRGGAIALDDTFYAEIHSNTIVSNVAAGSKDPVGGAIDAERHGHEYNGMEPLGRDFAPGFSDAKIYNNIIWNNLRLKYDQKPHSDEEDLDWRFGINHVWTPDNFHVDDPAVQPESESHLNSEAFSVVEFNCIDSGEYADRTGNVSVDPQFVDPDSGDWRLAPNSPVSHMGAHSSGGGLPPSVGTVSPLAAEAPMCTATCFAINEVTVSADETSLTVRGTMGAGRPFDPQVDGVRLEIGDGAGHTVDAWIPPGSFQPDGDPAAGVLKYVGPVPGGNVEIDALIQGCGFTMTTTRAPTTARPVRTKMMISLSIGDVLGREAVMLTYATGRPAYVREVQFDCCPIQPIDFDHSEHMEEGEANLTCQDCHVASTTPVFTGIPKKENCFSCHVAAKGDGDGGMHELAELAPYENNDVGIPWVPMAILRPGVEFSHDLHLSDGQIDCQDCHTDLASLNHPRKVMYRFMTMRQCRLCHEEHGAADDCQACHLDYLLRWSYAGDTDDDNDCVLDGADNAPMDPNSCGDVDGDGCDDCAVGVDGFGPLCDADPSNDGTDTDGDGQCDLGDPDDDNDGVPDESDSSPSNPNLCEDTDGDGCDDCAVGTDGFGPLADNQPAHDGTDTDGDGQCAAGDVDDDSDCVLDAFDTDPSDPTACEDVDGDGCDDCALGVDGVGPLCDADPADDGTDTDGDGQCDAGDPDDDNDGVLDGSDSSPNNPDLCEDVDGDGCDDCAVGTDDFGPLADNEPAGDGTDTDGDGQCDAGDTDDDNDCVVDAFDTDPLDPGRCQDVDGDGCDDCSSGVDGFGPLCDNDPFSDGVDTDGDGQCDASDPDDDNDGVPDASDSNPFNPNLCQDTDGDGCDDCTVGTDGFGPLDDNDPANDGADTDGDGKCDAGDPCPADPLDDADGDGLCSSEDNCPDHANVPQEDCDGDGIGDVCAIAGGASTDCNGDSIPDDCVPPLEPPQTDSALPDLGHGTMNRFITFVPVNAGVRTAVRVTLVGLPDPFDVWNGAELWVGPPIEVSENGGSVNPIPGSASFNVATLQCAPFYADWSGFGVVDVFHESVIPSASYRAQVVAEDCDAARESSFSHPLDLNTARWGDTISDFSAQPPGPPNGVVSILDAMAVIERFGSSPNSIRKARADLVSDCLDLVINITDVISVLSGFQGAEYPFGPSVADPCDSTCFSPLP